MSDAQRVVLSLPNNVEDYDRSILSPFSFRPYQVLFGGEAQFLAAAHVFKRNGAAAAFTPNPENFNAGSIHRLNAWFNQADGEAGAQPEIVHYRFGPPSTARILKGVKNVICLGGVNPRTSFGYSELLHGSHEVIYDGFAEAHVYQTTETEIATRGGQTIATQRLSRDFVRADLDDGLAAYSRLSRQEQFDFAKLALHAVAFSEYDQAQWSAAPSGETKAALSLQFNRALVEIGKARPAHGFVLIPYDLSDDGSIVPSLIKILTNFRGFQESGLKIGIAPFNHQGRVGVLTKLVTAATSLRDRRAAWWCANSLFVVRLLDAGHIGLLKSLFPVAILDGANPEAYFTSERIRAAGIKPLRVVEANASAAPDPGDTECDYETVEDFDDEYGRRSILSPRLTPRRARLLFDLALTNAQYGARQQA